MRESPNDDIEGDCQRCNGLNKRLWCTTCEAWFCSYCFKEHSHEAYIDQRRRMEYYFTSQEFRDCVNQTPRPAISQGAIGLSTQVLPRTSYGTCASCHDVLSTKFCDICAVWLCNADYDTHDHATLQNQIRDRKAT